MFLQAFLQSIGSAVAVDLLDATDLLDLLIVSRSHVFIAYEIEMMVLVVACCNLVLPTILLVALSLGRYGRNSVWLKRLRILHRVVLFALVCVRQSLI